MLRASLTVLRSIDPAPELVWFAKDAASTLFLAGETQRAMAWYVLAQQQSEANDEAKAATIALWPLVMLVDEGDGDWDQGCRHVEARWQRFVNGRAAAWKSSENGSNR